MFILPLRDKELETISLLVAKLNAYFLSRLVKCFADGLARKQFGVEGLWKADCGFVQDRLSLLTANHVWNVTLLENLPNELTHTGCDEDEFDLCDWVFEDLDKFSLVD